MFSVVGLLEDISTFPTFGFMGSEFAIEVIATETSGWIGAVSGTSSSVTVDSSASSSSELLGGLEGSMPVILKLVFLFLVWSASTATDPAPDVIGVVVDRTLLSAFVDDVSIGPCDGRILGLFSPLTNCIWGFAGLGGGCAIFKRNLTEG